MATTTGYAHPAQTTAAQGTLAAAGAGITGGYTGDSLSLKIVIAYLVGLALYNVVEILVLIFVTFNKYRGLYFWSLFTAACGTVPYSLGYLVKFFQLLDPNQDEGYVAVVLLSIGWYAMVSGQSVVLWSRLHLVTNSRRVLDWTLYMIIVDGVLLHVPTSVLTFGANANNLSDEVLARFVRGYSIMEKIQMVGFFLQELVLSAIYIKETVRILNLSNSISQNEAAGVLHDGHPQHGKVRKTMYQLIAINAIIIALDIALLGVELANLYLIETVLKGAVYSIKLKLEFAVLGKLVQVVRTGSSSDPGNLAGSGNDERRTASASANDTSLSKTDTATSTSRANGNSMALGSLREWPEFVDPARINGDVTHAEPVRHNRGSRDRGSRDFCAEESWKESGTDGVGRRMGTHRDSWIEEEMDKHNIG